MRKAVALFICTVGLSGCLTSNVLVIVRPDGSGTVEQTSIMRPSALAEFQRLVSPELAAPPPDPAAISRELQKYAVQARLGRNLRADLPGVTLAREHDITIDFENPSLQPSSVAPPQATAPTDGDLPRLALEPGREVDHRSANQHLKQSRLRQSAVFHPGWATDPFFVRSF